MTFAGILALALIAAGGALGAARRSPRLGLRVQLAGVLLAGVVAVVLLADGTMLGAPFTSGLHARMGADGLTALLVVVIAVVAVPALLYAADSLPASGAGRAQAALTAGFVLALLGVVLARDVVTFLAFWELMTLLPAAAAILASQSAEVRRAIFTYLAITHFGGAGVWVAMLVLAHEGALGAQLAPGGPQAIVAVAAIVGFGTKAGLMPLHPWLPRAHPVAPSHMSALMSGVMLKVAIYGLVRVLFEWLGPAPLWVGLAVLALGLLSALGGVLYALVQRELKRLLAFSSIENVGIIALGLGASLVLTASDQQRWAAIAFAAALLHTLNHAVFKALLFLGAGAFGHAVGALRLDRLGGLLRTMPRTGAAFLVGCAAIAGLPVLNGFASEWLTLQALLRVAFDGSPGVALAGALAVAGLGATAALAALCFVGVAGLTLLGAPRTPQAEQAREAPAGMRASVALLAGCCVVLGLVPGLLLPTLAGLGGAVSPPATVDLALEGTGSLPAPWIALALLTGVAALMALVARAPRARPTPAWTCGQPVVEPLAWTAAGFTKPLRLMLEALLRPRRELERREQGGVVQAIAYRSEVPLVFDTFVYGPAHRLAVRAAAGARRLQSGSLRTYVAYLLALVLALLGFARLGGLG